MILQGWHTNHDLRKGDIVQIARWEPELLAELDMLFRIKPWIIDDVKFVVVIIDHRARTIGIIPKNERITQALGRVPLDGASLIRVGRLA
jgi:hypothetical protein